MINNGYTDKNNQRVTDLFKHPRPRPRHPLPPKIKSIHSLSSPGPAPKRARYFRTKNQGKKQTKKQTKAYSLVSNGVSSIPTGALPSQPVSRSHISCPNTSSLSPPARRWGPLRCRRRHRGSARPATSPSSSRRRRRRARRGRGRRRRRGRICQPPPRSGHRRRWRSRRTRRPCRRRLLLLRRRFRCRLCSSRRRRPQGLGSMTDRCSGSSGTPSRVCRKRTQAWTSTWRTGLGWISPSTSGRLTTTTRPPERKWIVAKPASQRRSVLECRTSRKRRLYWLMCS